MASDPDLRFYRHAYLHVKMSRRVWTADEQRWTILTMYDAEPAIRQHYATSNAENPALFALFPDEPYTEDDFIVARSHLCYPNQVASLPHVPPIPHLHFALPVTQAIIVIRPIAPSTKHNRKTQTETNALIRSGAPYEHWPPLPWADEPNLPEVGTRDVTLPKQDEFMNKKPYFTYDETRWHGAKWLGSGSYGAVGLWCEVDEQFNVLDRMVVKDNAAAPRDAWRDPKNWRDRLPREIAIHRRVEARRKVVPDAFQYIIKYRGHRLLMSKRRFRLYADFASGGNFGEAMKTYDDKWHAIKFRNVDTEDCLPEAFIWYTIKALATACVALENGTLDDDSVADWKPIMHLDFQPPNILLDVQSKKRKHPDDLIPDPSEAGPSKRSKNATARAENSDKQIVPKLADFGLSIFDLFFSHCPALDENPQDHTLFFDSTITRYAPEYIHYNASDPIRLDARTDIWGLGRIAWGLIVNTWESHGPVRENGALDEVTGDALPLSRNQDENLRLGDRYDREVLIGSKDWPAARRYGEELKDLVRDCLKYEKEDRPSPREVLDRANRWLQANAEVAEGAADVVRNLLDLPDNDGLEVGQLLVVKRPGT